jgi:uncharacterized repeat protein (TIGR01451 family)
MTVTVNTPAAAGVTTISNTAAHSVNGGGSTSTNTVSNTVLAEPKVTIAKAQANASASGGYVTPGSTTTYTLTVTNPPGSVPATGITVADYIPAGTTYVGGSCAVVAPAAGTCTYTAAPDPVVAFTITSPSPLTAGGTLDVKFDVTVDSPAADGATIANSGTVSAATNVVGTTYTAPSNIVSYGVTAAPIIGVTKAASPVSGSDVGAGDVIVYTVTVSNTGTANTQSAYVVDAIPAGTTYVANTTCLNGTLTAGTPWTCAGANGILVPELTPGVPPAGGGMTVYSPGQGDADGGTLVVGSPATVQFAVTVNGTPDITNPSGVITNQATAGTATTAAVQSNATTHTKKADLSIVKTGPANAGSGANGGDPVSYSLVVSNAGPSAAPGAVVTDPAVAYFDVDSVTCAVTSGGAVCPSSLTVAELQGPSGLVIPTFPKDSSLTFTVNGTAHVTNDLGATITNVATVTKPAGVADPEPSNNTSTAVTNVTPASPTLVVIAGVRAYVENGRPWLEWETASEVRTAGFNLLRRDPDRAGFVRINARLLPAVVGARRGAVYRFVDPTAVAGGTYAYGIEEVEVTGKVRRYGPYTVTYGVRQATAGTQKVRALAATRAAAAPRVPAGPDGFEATARMVEGRSADPAVTAQAKAAAAGPAGTNTAMRIFVEGEGLYAVGADQIAAALGKSLTTVKSSITRYDLRLQNRGQAVAWRADPTGDRLYFYGQAVQGTDAVHTRYNVYVLDQASGAAMRAVAGTGPAPAAGSPYFTSRAHAEENLWSLTTVTNDPDADFWYWDYVYVTDPGPGAKLPFSVPTPGATGAGTATISAYLQGASDLAPGNDHHARLRVNGQEVASASWDGMTPTVIAATFDASLLKTDGSSNTVEVQGELDAGVPYSVFWVDRFDVDYPRLYRATDNALRVRGAGNAVVTVSGYTDPAIAVVDVTDPPNPRWLTATTVTTTTAGGRAVSFAPATPTTDYLVAVAKAPSLVQGYAPTTLKSSTAGAAYLALAPSVLRDGASALATYRGGKVVELQSIYDEFNNGIASPNAIRAFLAYAAQNWRTPPRFVALVGKGTYDPKDHLGLGTNLFPVAMGPTPEGLFAADNRYADLDGDGVPDLAVGRIPALTNADVLDYLAKVQAYESRARRPASQALVVADDPDDGGDFAANGQAVAASLQAKGYTTTLLNLAGSTPEAVRAQIVAALNSPAGVGLFNYVGHGGSNQLADENLLSNDPGNGTLDALYSPGNKLPIFLAFTCEVGDGSNPGYDSLAESLLWRRQGGVVAGFAPSALSDNAQAHTLNTSMVNALAGKNASATLGEAAAAALADFARKGGLRYMRDVYSVIGDPGLRVQQ